MDFSDRVALVTGGSSGIGRATAEAFAAAGARVLIADVDAERGAELAQALRDDGAEAMFVACDVGDAAQVEAAVRVATERWGRLDCAFNNAGREGTFAPFLDWDEALFDDLMQTNVKGVWLCMKAELEAMVQTGGGAIVNTASVAGLVGARGLSVYAATKHAVVGLTRSAAIEFARAGVRVNAICPGFIDTPMFDRTAVGDMRQKILRGVPQHRLGTPEEIASAVLWLCSSGAGYVTGATLAADGGLTAM